MQLLHTLHSHLELEQGGVTLFRYVTDPQTVPVESPRPYLHPLRTLGGRVVSGFRPNDHRWHQGLSLTSAYLGGHNFWGGATFVGDAYRQLDNNGRQEVMGYEGLQIADDVASIRHQLRWLTAAGHDLLWEERELEVRVRPELGFWILKWNSQLTLLGDRPVGWGSPTTQGRHNAGYGGLFWRGPRDFSGGQILLDEGRGGSDVMGQRSPWLAYIGRHDETDDASTLVFIDDSQNPRFPTQWFVRNTAPMVSPNFAFSEEYTQQPGEVLELNYQILIADGAWNREEIETLVTEGL